MNRNKNNSLENYRNEIIPYVNTRNKDNADYSAEFLYGKFLNYLSNKDYAGASLTKKYLRNGKFKCRRLKNNKFKLYHSRANKNKTYKRLKRDFIDAN